MKAVLWYSQKLPVNSQKDWHFVLNIFVKKRDRENSQHASEEINLPNLFFLNFKN